MKLIIDISEETYKQVKMCINGINNIVEIRSAIRQSTPLPDNATNGEVFLNVFKGSKEIGEDNRYQIGVSMSDGYDRYFDIDWWNAPYKKGECNE